MDIQTHSLELTDSTKRPNQNFTAFVLQQKIFKRSSIGLMFLDKESLNFNEKTNHGFTNYNRNIGIEYNLATASNLWTGKAMVMKSFSPNKSGNDVMQAYKLSYAALHWNINLQYENVGQNYNPEIGYVPRRGYYRISSPNIYYAFYPKKESSGTFYQAPTYLFDYYWNSNGELTDAVNTFQYFLYRKSLSYLEVYFKTNFYKLQYDFDPTNKISNDVLKAGSEYRFNTVGVNYSSSPRKKYTIRFNGEYGGYFGEGKLSDLTFTIGYRFQPYVNFLASISNVDINEVKVPIERKPDKIVNSNFWLVSPKVDITFSNKLFWTTFVQYNEQTQNVNINSRFQWRYQPASDIFLVYTDNYLPGSLTIKNRAIVLKWTYWWNL